MKKRKSLLEKPGKLFLFVFATATAVYSCKKVSEKDYDGLASSGTTAVSRSYGDGMSDEMLHAQTEHLVAVIWNHTAAEWNAVKPNNETEAIDYMEAVLNYTHSHSFAEPLEINSYSQAFTFTSDAEGGYPLEDYSATFEQMSDYIVAIYDSTTATEKNVIAINLEPVPGAANTVMLHLLLGIGYVGEGPALRSFSSNVYDDYKYDRVSGHCTMGGPRGACVQLEDYGNYNMRWYRSSGGTALRTMGYYQALNVAKIDITSLSLVTGTNRPSAYGTGVLDFQIFAFDTWKGMTNMPCINRPQMNFYLDQIRPLFLSLMAGQPYREFVYLTVNPKYRAGGTLSAPSGWGSPNWPGFNTTGTTLSTGAIVTQGSNNASGRGTYYEHYYIFEYGRYINKQPSGTYRKL